jgi:hypothetical protein
MTRITTCDMCKKPIDVHIYPYGSGQQSEHVELRITKDGYPKTIDLCKDCFNKTGLSWYYGTDGRIHFEVKDRLFGIKTDELQEILKKHEDEIAKYFSTLSGSK